MSASFSFEVDKARGLVRIAMSGLFTPADILAFAEARRRAHETLGCAPNRHLTLNDLRQMKIQPQETVVGFQEMLADPAYRSRRLAFIVPATLARGQLKRAVDIRNCRYFTDPGEAEAWLLSEGDEAARP